MTVDPGVFPGLLVLVAELLALSMVGYVVARVALRQTDHRLALAQGLVIGPAVWGLIVNFVLHVLPGLAGAVAGWLIVLGVGAGLAWRWRTDLRLPGRTLAGFAVAGTAIFWLALASRQLLIIPDHLQHTLIPATIRAGNWPPRLPWNPDLNLAYHYGADLLAGLLTPPDGPDLAFTTEVLGAYAWTALILLVGSLLLRLGSWLSTLVLLPLVLAPGAWTLVFGGQPAILEIPIPRSLGEPGLRTALLDVYWPQVELPWRTEQHSVPPNIWKPSFPMAYALALVLLERVSRRRRGQWGGTLTLAGLVGFLGLVEEAIAGVVLAVWVALEAGRSVGWRRPHTKSRAAFMHAAAGPVLGAALLLGGGGLITGVITERMDSGGLSLGIPLDPRGRGALISVEPLPGGLGLLEVGTVVVAALAVILERRSQLIIALAAGSAVFLVAALTIRLEVAPYDIGRLDGHARNFALFAVLFSLSTRLARGRVRWRVAACAAILFLVTWPTIAVPARQLGLVASRGVQLANAEPSSREFGVFYWWMGRYTLLRFPSDAIAAWIREHSETNARVLSPDPYAMTVATGRPNASGFRQYPHLIPYTGPEYLDAIRHLEPEAFRRLDVAFLHADDDWVAGLPERARRRLANPEFFNLILRDGTHSLYGVRPAFLELNDPPAPESYEALRQVAPAGADVYVSPALNPLNALRAMAMLTHTNLLESEDRATLNHLRADISVKAVGREVPDLILTSSRLAPSVFAPESREPVWWNEDGALYAPAGALTATTNPRPRPFSVQLSVTDAMDGQLAFTASFNNRASTGWTGQDWVVMHADGTPMPFPRPWPADQVTQWYAGQVSPQSGSVTHSYVIDPQTVTLRLRGPEGSLSALASSGDGLDPGDWILAVRLRDAYQLAALIPTMTITVSDSGVVSYRVHEGELAIQPSYGPVTLPERTYL